MPKRWLELFGGPENETEGVQYKTAPFLVSNKCCYFLKEKPCDDWAKEHNSHPYLGMMASEGGQREEALIEHGCNYYGKTVMRSAPFAPFTRQDLLRLAVELEVPVPEIYGTIERNPDGTLYTTKAQRTGCSMCGFGIHMEKRPHRFDMLRERNEKEPMCKRQGNRRGVRLGKGSGLHRSGMGRPVRGLGEKADEHF